MTGSYGSSIFSFLRNLHIAILFSIVAVSIYIPNSVYVEYKKKKKKVQMNLFAGQKWRTDIENGRVNTGGERQVG